ncbi:hypothetical protein TRVA0_052S01244 [Trichomonascus vanleenenianus]|uniref:uncharacterized protein n=1 Tax=Trichomonascus vanleenenianus TaxID=2268995 RepID=UPI003ECA623D
MSSRAEIEAHIQSAFYQLAQLDDARDTRSRKLVQLRFSKDPVSAAGRITRIQDEIVAINQQRESVHQEIDRLSSILRNSYNAAVYGRRSAFTTH